MIFLFLLFSFVQHSCMLHEVAVNTMQPGIAAIPEQIQRFILVDLTGKNHESLCALQIGLIKDSSYSSAIRKCDTSLYSPGENGLSWNKVGELLHNDTTKSLITLEKTGQYMRVDPTVITSTTKTKYYNQRTGDWDRYVITPNYKTERCYTYQWKIYDLKSKKVFGSYRYEYTDSSQWYAGTAFANRLLPHYEVIKRVYYVTGGKNMRSAGFLVRKGEWTKACAMWERETKRKSASVRRKAYYNLAIAEEKAGNITRAIEYARKAKELGDPNADFYILILQYELKAMQD